MDITAYIKEARIERKTKESRDGKLVTTYHLLRLRIIDIYGHNFYGEWRNPNEALDCQVYSTTFLAFSGHWEGSSLEPLSRKLHILQPVPNFKEIGTYDYRSKRTQQENQNND